jgi:hypothetical protein
MKISIKKLKEIIRDTIQHTINESNIATNENILSYWDLAKLTQKQLMFLGMDLRLFLEFQNYDNKIFYNNGRINIDENVERKTKNVEYVKNYLFKNLGLKDWQFSERQGTNDVQLIMLVGDVGMNIDIITKAMETMGWFQSYITKPQKINGINVRCIAFDPIYQDKIKDEVRDEWNYLYHLTPSENIESVLSNGIIPSSKNKLFHYPNRVYLLKPTVTHNEVVSLAKRLASQCSIQNGRYALFQIDLNKAPKNVDFSYDPRHQNGVYTYQQIPKDAIIDYITIDLSNN